MTRHRLCGRKETLRLPSLYHNPRPTPRHHHPPPPSLPCPSTTESTLKPSQAPPKHLRLQRELCHLAAQPRQQALLVQRAQGVQVLWFVCGVVSSGLRERKQAGRLKPETPGGAPTLFPRQSNRRGTAASFPLPSPPSAQTTGRRPRRRYLHGGDERGDGRRVHEIEAQEVVDAHRLQLWSCVCGCGQKTGKRKAVGQSFVGWFLAMACLPLVGEWVQQTTGGSFPGIS